MTAAVIAAPGFDGLPAPYQGAFTVLTRTLAVPTEATWIVSSDFKSAIA